MVNKWGRSLRYHLFFKEEGLSPYKRWYLRERPHFHSHLIPSFRVRKIIPHIIPKGDLLNSHSLCILRFH